jgi:uncharacterized protein (UPF0276 family)
MLVESARTNFQFRDLVALFPWIPAGPVLDAGFGKGFLAAALDAHGFRVEAIDIVPGNVQGAYNRYGGGVNWKVSDIRQYKLKREHYAAIFCMNVLPFIPNDERPRLIGRLKAALKPGGVLILSGFNQNDPANYDEKFAHGLNSGKNKDNGILANGELAERFNGWEFWHNFEGFVHENHPPDGPHVHGISEIIVRKPKSQISEKIIWENLPHLGAGLGWRSQIADIIEQPGVVDFIEIMLDDYLDPLFDKSLNHLCQKFKVIPHGVELSVGSAHGLDEAYLQDTARVIDRCGSPWWSDHLCFTQSENYKTFTLNPLPATEEALETVKTNVNLVKKYISTPLLLENVAYYARPSHAEMDDAIFLKRVAEESDCGILLDVANLFGNARNLGIHPQDFIDALPGERIIQVHLAGGRIHQQLIFDTHDRPIWKETWDLLEYVLKKCDIKGVTIERDAGYETPQELIDEVNRARKMFGMRIL